MATSYKLVANDQRMSVITFGGGAVSTEAPDISIYDKVSWNHFLFSDRPYLTRMST